MTKIKKLLKSLRLDRLSAVLIIIWLITAILLYLLWRFLIVNNQLMIYTPISIFPFQFSVLVMVLNGILALAVIRKSPSIAHLLLFLANFINVLNVIMVLYSYRFFINV